MAKRSSPRNDDRFEEVRDALREVRDALRDQTYYLRRLTDPVTGPFNRRTIGILEARTHAAERRQSAQQRAGQHRVEDLRALAEHERKVASEIMNRHPDWGTATVAKEIAKTVQRPWRTIRDHIAPLFQAKKKKRDDE